MGNLEARVSALEVDMAAVKAQYQHLVAMTEHQNGALDRIESAISDPEKGIHVRVDRLSQASMTRQWWGRALANTLVVSVGGTLLVWLVGKVLTLVHLVQQHRKD